MAEIIMPNRIGKTTVTYRPARDILTRTSGFIKTYDFTLNPYSGCSFGCSYCYAAFFSRDQAQQDNWGLWVNAKENAARLLDNLKPGELDGKRIYMSSVTDPYQPLEQKIELTQEILEALADRHRPKLVVQTRSPLVTRDIRLFQEIEQKGGRVQVNMTVTTDDEDVRKTFEPGCPSNPGPAESHPAGPEGRHPVLHHHDAPAAGAGRGGLRPEPAGHRRRALHRPDLPLPEGRVHRPDPAAGLRHHGGEAGMSPEPLPAGVHPALPGRLPGAPRTPSPARGGPAGLRATVLKAAPRRTQATQEQHAGRIQQGQETGTGVRRMAAVPDRNRPEGPKKKHWLSRTSTWLAFGAIMGMAATATFVLMGLASFQNEEKALGTGYMVIAGVSTPVTIILAWLMGRN